MGFLGFDVGYVFVEVFEFFYGRAERYDFVVGVLGFVVFRFYGCSLETLYLRGEIRERECVSSLSRGFRF